MSRKRFEMNKKAIATNVLVTVLISVVFLLIVGGIMKNVDTNKNEQEKENRCKASIDNRARTAIGINDDSDWSVVKASLKGSPVLCETIKKKLKGDKVETLRSISEKMARCWWMFGEGRYEEILKGSDFSMFFHGVETENACFDCYNLMIDKRGIDISSEELYEYMFKEKMLRHNVTYLDYIQSNGGPGRMVFLAPDGIKSDNVYTISFAAKNKDRGSSIWTAIGVGIGVGVVMLTPVGWVAGTATLVATAGAGYAADTYAEYSSEREMSTIFFSHLKSGDNFCDDGVVD